MSEHAVRALRQLLAADEADTAFLAFLPDAAVERLLQAAQETVEQAEATLAADIAAAGSALPAPLGRLARAVLG